MRDCSAEVRSIISAPGVVSHFNHTPPCILTVHYTSNVNRSSGEATAAHDDPSVDRGQSTRATAVVVGSYNGRTCHIITHDVSHSELVGERELDTRYHENDGWRRRRRQCLRRRCWIQFDRVVEAMTIIKVRRSGKVEDNKTRNSAKGAAEGEDEIILFVSLRSGKLYRSASFIAIGMSGKFRAVLINNVHTSSSPEGKSRGSNSSNNNKEAIGRSPHQTLDIVECIPDPTSANSTSMMINQQRPTLGVKLLSPLQHAQRKDDDNEPTNQRETISIEMVAAGTVRLPYLLTIPTTQNYSVITNDNNDNNNNSKSSHVCCYFQWELIPGYGDQHLSSSLPNSIYYISRNMICLHDWTTLVKLYHRCARFASEEYSWIHHNSNNIIIINERNNVYCSLVIAHGMIRRISKVVCIMRLPRKSEMVISTILLPTLKVLNCSSTALPKHEEKKQEAQAWKKKLCFVGSRGTLLSLDDSNSQDTLWRKCYLPRLSVARTYVSASSGSFNSSMVITVTDNGSVQHFDMTNMEIATNEEPYSNALRLRREMANVVSVSVNENIVISAFVTKRDVLMLIELRGTFDDVASESKTTQDCGNIHNRIMKGLLTKLAALDQEEGTKDDKVEGAIQEMRSVIRIAAMVNISPALLSLSNGNKSKANVALDGRVRIKSLSTNGSVQVDASVGFNDVDGSGLNQTCHVLNELRHSPRIDQLLKFGKSETHWNYKHPPPLVYGGMALSFTSCDADNPSQGSTVQVPLWNWNRLTTFISLRRSYVSSCEAEVLYPSAKCLVDTPERVNSIRKRKQGTTEAQSSFIFHSCCYVKRQKQSGNDRHVGVVIPLRHSMADWDLASLLFGEYEDEGNSTKFVGSNQHLSSATCSGVGETRLPSSIEKSLLRKNANTKTLESKRVISLSAKVVTIGLERIITASKLLRIDNLAIELSCMPCGKNHEIKISVTSESIVPKAEIASILLIVRAGIVRRLSNNTLSERDAADALMTYGRILSSPKTENTVKTIIVCLEKYIANQGCDGTILLVLYDRLREIEFSV